MKKMTIVLATLGFGVTPAIAETLVDNGTIYTYDVTQVGHVKVIRGTDSRSRPFELRVARGWVEGTVDGKTVSFSLRDVKPLTTAATSTVVATR